MEEAAAADSIRMASPSRFEIMFKSTSASIPREARATMQNIAKTLTADTLLRLVLTARPDTSATPARALALAARRLEAVRKRLTGDGGISERRITTVTRGQKGTEAGSPDMLQAEATGRLARVVGRISTFVLSPESDDRARRADSLSVGDVSPPFFYKSGYSILRLDGREQARRKTYDEAAPEVATAYQDHESKRLEAKWLAKLRTSFPVSIHRERLADAFAEKP
jgi:hypothetical protein